MIGPMVAALTVCSIWLAVGGRASPISASPQSHRAADRLARLHGLWLAATTFGLGTLIGSPLVMVMGPIGVGAARRGTARRRELRTQSEVRAQVLALVDGLTLEVNSGQALAVAVRGAVAEVPEPLGCLLDPMRGRLRAGEPIERAVTRALGSNPDLDLVLFTLGVIETSGGPTATALGRLAETLRHRNRASAERAAQSSQAITSALVMAALPFGFGLMVAAISHDVASFYLTQWGGAMCVAVATLLVLAGLMWIDRSMHGTVEPQGQDQ